MKNNITVLYIMTKLIGGRRRTRRSGSKRRYCGGSTVPIIQGGSGAAEFGQSVYGSAGEQHAVNGGDNTIAMNHSPALSYSGGGSLTPALVTGGGGLPYSVIGDESDVVKTPYGGSMVDFAVPAALLIANNAYGRRTTGPVHAIGNMGRSMTRSVSNVGKSMGKRMRRSVSFSPFKGRKSRRRRTRGGKMRGG